MGVLDSILRAKPAPLGFLSLGQILLDSRSRVEIPRTSGSCKRTGCFDLARPGGRHLAAISASATGTERKDAKVQSRKESPEAAAFEKYPGDSPRVLG